MQISWGYVLEDWLLVQIIWVYVLEDWLLAQIIWAYVLENWLFAQISRGGMSFRTGCSASSHGLVAGSCCESIALDGHPTPPQCQEQLVHICRSVDCALNLSAQLIPNVFHLV